MNELLLLDLSSLYLRKSKTFNDVFWYVYLI